MLHAVAREHFNTAIVEHHRNMYGKLARGRAKHFLHALVEAKTLGGLVEACFGTEPGIGLLYVWRGGIRLRCARFWTDGRGRLQNHVRSASTAIMSAGGRAASTRSGGITRPSEISK